MAPGKSLPVDLFRIIDCFGAIWHLGIFTIHNVSHFYDDRLFLINLACLNSVKNKLYTFLISRKKIRFDEEIFQMFFSHEIDQPKFSWKINPLVTFNWKLLVKSRSANCSSNWRVFFQSESVKQFLHLGPKFLLTNNRSVTIVQTSQSRPSGDKWSITFWHQTN